MNSKIRLSSPMYEKKRRMRTCADGIAILDDVPDSIYKGKEALFI